MSHSVTCLQVLLEFKEYATEVDVDFVRRSVRAIGRCAISLERAAERCINVLIELIHTKVNYVVQEAFIVIKDIFRRYPNRWEPVMPLTKPEPHDGNTAKFGLLAKATCAACASNKSFDCTGGRCCYVSS